MDLRRRLFVHLTRRIRQPVPLALVFWDGETIALSPAPKATLTFATPRCGRLLLRGDLDGLCDAYVSGELIVDGTMADIVSCGIEVAGSLARIPLAALIVSARAVLPRRHSRKRDAEDIRFHYDVSNDFFALWLDRNMVYSCAYFRDGTEDIDQAQEQKLDYICRKLQLRKDDAFLDVGCGWGGLVARASGRYGAKAVGATISPAQASFARALLAGCGSSDGATILEKDYRDIGGEARFDKIASVGMYEHVGLANLKLYFERMARLLKPGGVLLNHGIYLPNAEGTARGPRVDFIGKYVFPGGELPTLAAVVERVARAGLEVADFEDLRPHYVRTLNLWLQRLEARKEQAIYYAGEKRYRIWRLFLGGMAFAFDAGWLSVGQLVAYKPAGIGSAWRPLTRDHQYDAGRAFEPAPRIDRPAAGERDALHA